MTLVPVRIQIKHRWTGTVLYECEANSVGEAVSRVVGADLRGADLRGADLRGADLRGAAMRRADLSDADLRGAAMRGADLRGAVLRVAAMRGADLRGADLSRADLRGADLRVAVLRGADLSDADLRDADLRDADLRGADLRGAIGITDSTFGIVADPDLPRRVAAAALASYTALDMSHWHTCETTHCLAGWAIHLSGPAGYALEAATSPSVAGAMLMPSATHLFLASNNEARAWLREQLKGE